MRRALSNFLVVIPETREGEKGGSDSSLASFEENEKWGEGEGEERGRFTGVNFLGLLHSFFEKSRKGKEEKKGESDLKFPGIPMPYFL